MLSGSGHTGIYRKSRRRARRMINAIIRKSRMQSLPLFKSASAISRKGEPTPRSADPCGGPYNKHYGGQGHGPPHGSALRDVALPLWQQSLGEPLDAKLF